MPPAFPAFLVLILLSGCVSVSSSQDAVRSSVVSGQVFRNHVGSLAPSLAPASAGGAVGAAYLAYLGSDASYHYFRQRNADGDRQYWVPRGDLTITQEFRHDPSNPRALPMEYANFGNDNPYEIRWLGNNIETYPRPFNAPRRANSPMAPAFGIEGGEPLPPPLNGTK